jgi:hypothetical protein
VCFTLVCWKLPCCLCVYRKLYGIRWGAGSMCRLVSTYLLLYESFFFSRAHTHDTYNVRQKIPNSSWEKVPLTSRTKLPRPPKKGTYCREQKVIIITHNFLFPLPLSPRLSSKVSRNPIRNSARQIKDNKEEKTMKGSSHHRRNDRKGVPTSVDIGSLADDLDKLLSDLRPSPYHKDRPRTSSPVAPPPQPQGNRFNETRRSRFLGRTMNKRIHGKQGSAPRPTPRPTPRPIPRPIPTLRNLIAKAIVKAGTLYNVLCPC